MILEWRFAHKDGVPEVISGWPYDRVCKDAEGCVGTVYTESDREIILRWRSWGWWNSSISCFHRMIRSVLCVVLSDINCVDGHEGGECFYFFGGGSIFCVGVLRCVFFFLTILYSVWGSRWA